MSYRLQYLCDCMSSRKRFRPWVRSAILIVFFTMSLVSSQAEDDPRLIADLEGVVQIARAFDISASSTSKVMRLHFVEGQLVERGDLLVEFDSTVSKLEARITEQKVVRANVQHLLALEKLERLEKLKQKNAVSQADYLLAVHSAEIAAADLALAQIRAELAEVILGNQKLHAPFNGQMSAPRVREGSRVVVDSTSEIATIFDLNPINIRFPVAYDRILSSRRSVASREELNDKIELTLIMPGGDAYEHTGRLISNTFGVDTATSMGSVLVQFPNPDYVLRPGLKVAAKALWKELPQ
ncbi:Toluene efflux pump periplasmic linker protein TtgD precursor [Roseibium album]|nr:Toluene efflux pump periplasmic linker protein TtgD precursor [Roseibium album]